MEAYSKHPVVCAKLMSQMPRWGFGEFLGHVRRIVVDYIVGQVLSGEHGADMAAADRLDEVTAYYLLHRNDFKMDVVRLGHAFYTPRACGLSDAELEKTWNIISHAGGALLALEDDDDEDPDATESEGEPEDNAGGGSKVKLKSWNHRQHKSMGFEAPEGRAVPLIDRIHRVMHLWKDWRCPKLDEYLDKQRSAVVSSSSVSCNRSSSCPAIANGRFSKASATISERKVPFVIAAQHFRLAKTHNYTPIQISAGNHWHLSSGNTSWRSSLGNRGMTL